MKNISKVLDYSRYCIFSLSISAGLLAILLYTSFSSVSSSILHEILEILTSIPLRYILFYIILSIIRTILQSYRYQRIIAVSEKDFPSYIHFFLVTTCRNMFIDMLPARLGELSFIAMLNKGYQVRASSCMSSLVISFVFDLLALTVFILVLIGWSLLLSTSVAWLVVSFCILVVLVGILYWLLFPFAVCFTEWINKKISLHNKLLGVCSKFVKDTTLALQQTRRAGIHYNLLFVSLGIRLTKYSGIYVLFTGVASYFPSFSYTPVQALLSLISAEISASLPIPNFMGFGVYEAGGMLTLTALGASKAVATVFMLTLHILSQIIDYALGGFALLVFLLITANRKRKKTQSARQRTRTEKIAFLLAVGIILFSGVILIHQVKKFKKLGAIHPPDSGKEIFVAETMRSNLSNVKGFIVWSSNRYGNHDILHYDLVTKKTRRLTTHPHTEYYPKISPDGQKVVFARAKKVWVSQRDNILWDIYLLDIASEKEILLALDGTVPTWSADGRHIFFLRKGKQVIRIDIQTCKEEILYETGAPGTVLSDTVVLETPHVHNDVLAVTLRGSERAVCTLDKSGNLRKYGKGCQIAWSPGGKFLYKVDHGGEGQNAIFRLDPASGEQKMWLDAPKPYSHEYFPQIDNTANYLVFGASQGDHEHDTADYELFLWEIGTRWEDVVRITYHTGNDCWPDIFIEREEGR